MAYHLEVPSDSLKIDKHSPCDDRPAFLPERGPRKANCIQVWQSNGGLAGVGHNVSIIPLGLSLNPFKFQNKLMGDDRVVYDDQIFIVTFFSTL